MPDVVITGPTSGIGRALALALAPRDLRLVLVGRDRSRLEALATELGGRAIAVPGDVGSVDGARALGKRLLDVVEPGAVLVHNAGLWPSRVERTPEGLEAAFVVNHVGPLLLQQPLLDVGRLARVMVVSAGLIDRGRFDPQRTPQGEDFSGFRTYCTTKLCFAVAMRDVAKAWPEVDVVVLHPGVVRTALGLRPGPLGWLIRLSKRFFETPETCAARLVRILDRPRWSPPGEARWLFEEEERPWPAVAEAAAGPVREATAPWLAGS